MKKLLITLLTVILVFAFGFKRVQAQTDSTNIAVRVVETPTSMSFYIHFTFLGDGTDSRFSRAINVSELDISTAQFTFKGNGVGSIDIDVSLHGGSQLAAVTSNDSTGASGTIELDNLLKLAAVTASQALGSTTPTLDPILPAAEEQAKGQWLVIEADGQTGNPTTALLSVGLYALKRAGASQKSFRQYPILVDTK